MIDMGAAAALGEMVYRRLAEPVSTWRARSSRPETTMVSRSACNLCEAICGIEVTTRDGRVTDIRGDRHDPLSLGHVCPKSVALADIADDPDRLRTPVRRVGDRWEPIGWQEAIELVARRLTDVRKVHGGNSVGVYLGNPMVHSLGGLTHGPLFSSMLGTHNHFSATSVDQLPHHVISYLLYGHQMLLPVPDLERTRHLLIFGANPRASNGSMMTAPDMARRLREIRQRGGRVVVVDPRRTETAADADEHIFIRPGSDAAVLLAMINVILARGTVELPDFIHGLDEVRTAVADFTPPIASRLSGVPAATTERLATDFAESGAAAAYGRIGVSTQRYGALCHWAIQVLNIVTGNLGRAGGTLFSDPAIPMTELAGAGGLGRRRSRVRGLASFGGEFPVATLAQEISTPGDGQIRAMVTMAGNPVLSTPAGAALDEAFAGLEFMVALDFYINETTRHAEVILPPTSALERDQYDLAFRSFAVRNTAKYTPAVLSKPVGTKHDWEILRDLGLAYLRHRGDRSPLGRITRWFDPKHLAAQFRLRLSPRDSLDLLLRTGPYRLTVRELLRHPSGLDLGPLRPGVEHRLRTRGRTITLLPEQMHGSFHALRAELEQDPDTSLRLIGRRHVRGNNSWMHNSARLVTGSRRHHLLMHPNDAARAGVADGPATLRSTVGAIRVDVQQTRDIMEGTVSLPHGFGHTRSGTVARTANQVAGASINDITDPMRVDELTGNAAFNGIPVTVEPLAAS